MAKILIVEDEKAMSDLVAVKFQVEGFEVVQAFSIAEAKEKFNSAGPFDVVLTDYLLPDGELVEFLTNIQPVVTTKHIPIVVMTNYIEDLNQDQLKALGAVDFLVKYQVVPAQMAEKIKTILAQAPQASPTTQP